jgi:F0F1-type ATP synthase delta subunit
MVNAAIRYAEALLTAAKQENVLPQVYDDMATLTLALSDGARAFSSPVFPLREQIATADAVLGDGFQPLTKRFVELLVAMRRMGQFKIVATTFDRIARKEMGIVDLHFTVFDDPAPEVASELVHAASEKGLFHDARPENVKPRFEVDKAILGGFVAESEGVSWDCSLKTRFMEMAKVLRGR